MTLIFFFIIILLFFLIFLSIGSIANSKLNIINRNNILDLILFGYSIFVLVSFHSYFVFNLNFEYLMFVLITILTLFLLKFNKLFFKNADFFINNLLIILFILIFFCLPTFIYGEQFYVFRGNYWDNFNYLSSAILFSKFDFFYLKSLNLQNSYQNFQSIDGIIVYRPFINYFLSIFLKFKIFDLFLLNFIFKVFLSIINFFAFVSFLDIFKSLKKKVKYLLSIVLTFSFFSLYIIEIEALSHLASISLFLFSIKFLYLFDKEFQIRNLIFFSIPSSALFIIYPEIFIIFGIIASSFILFKLKKSKFKNLIKNIIVCSTFFIFLTILSFEVNYKFLLLQISQALNVNIDWWTYFGAFIFGRENLVLDIEYIKLIEDNLKNKNLINLSKMFFLDHFENGYKLFYLNFIPSISGLYYLTVGKIENNNLFLYFFIILFLNLYLIFIICKNSTYLFKNENIPLKINILLISFIIIYLLIKGNFWTIIKIYTYCFPFIFIFLSIDLKKKQINKIILILFIIFPIYKYTSFNNGIGKLDSFPSIINKDYKNKINWNLDKNKLKKCKNIYTNETDYFVRAYINMKALYYDINFINLFDDDNKKIYCNAIIKDKNFVVKIIDD